MKIESRIGKSTSSDKQIFEFTSNFHNFKDLLPADKVSGWEASEDRCSFNVDPLGRTGLMIVEKEPNKMIKMTSDPQYSKYQFNIWIQLKRMANDDTRVKTTIEPKVSKMLLPMLKIPLKKLADGIVSKIETHSF
jgi:hypothetical protein